MISGFFRRNPIFQANFRNCRHQLQAPRLRAKTKFFPELIPYHPASSRMVPDFRFQSSVNSGGVAKSAEEIEQAWLERWWQADWSWKGLASKPVGQNGDIIHGGAHGEKTLQEYWRRDPETGVLRDDSTLFAAGELLEAPDGALWHLAHVPLDWRDGRLAKAGWDAGLRERLAVLITAKVMAAGETKTDRVGDAEGPDLRAQLSGTLLLEAPRHPDEETAPLHLVCDDAGLLSWDARALKFGPGYRCRNANFFEGADFKSAAFSGDANFNSAAFSGYVKFYSTGFSGNADFTSVTFLGDAYFNSAAFAGDVCFNSSAFSGDAEFNSATFSGYAEFHNVAFSGDANFNSAAFSGEAYFNSSAFSGEAKFYSAGFSANTDFNSAAFSRFADFNSAGFSGDANFESAAFSRYANFKSAAFAGKANFNNAAFSGDANFNSAAFSGDAQFYSAGFSGNASFSSAAFSGYANFRSAAFSGDATFAAGEFSAQADFTETRMSLAQTSERQRISSFAGRRFKDVATFSRAKFGGEMDFEASIFDRLARFDGLTFPATAALRQGMFNQAQFKDVVSFQGAGCQSFAAFDGAIFGAPPQLDNIGEQATNRNFRAELAQALELDAPARRAPIWHYARIAAWFSARKPEDAPQDTALKHLERGCRVLKQAMEKSSDKTREQMFYAFELTARRHQRDTPAWERFFSRAYALTGDYGRSIARPLLFLLATIPVFALFYWLLLPTAQDGWPRIYQSLTLSLGRVFPFGLWQVTGDAFQREVLGLGNTAISLAIRSLATLQSLLALVFAFLAGLALRRRFQIS